MDVLSVRNVYEDAERAINKKAALGADVTIENFTDETVNALDMIDDLDDLDKQTKKDLLQVGVDTEEKNRSGSFLQVDQSNIFTNNSMSDSIVKVPIGFHGLCQFGSGIFLLRKDASSEYYRWNAVTKEEPEAWKYRFPTGCNPRSSFFIALSCETGKSYAFAMGLEPIPNSEGAIAISPCGAYKGRHFYKI